MRSQSTSVPACVELKPQILRQKRALHKFQRLPPNNMYSLAVTRFDINRTTGASRHSGERLNLTAQLRLRANRSFIALRRRNPPCTISLRKGR